MGTSSLFSWSLGAIRANYRQPIARIDDARDDYSVASSVSARESDASKKPASPPSLSLTKFRGNESGVVVDSRGQMRAMRRAK